MICCPLREVNPDLKGFWFIYYYGFCGSFKLATFAHTVQSLFFCVFVFKTELRIVVEEHNLVQTELRKWSQKQNKCIFIMINEVKYIIIGDTYEF